MHPSCPTGRSRSLAQSTSSTLLSCGPGWPSAFLSLPDGRVSASMVGLLPSDPFVQKELLLVTHGDSVWASSPTSPTLDAIEQVLMMSAGYPSGVVAAHSGDAWLPSQAALFALSVFDCETWLWWG